MELISDWSGFDAAVWCSGDCTAAGLEVRFPAVGISQAGQTDADMCTGDGRVSRPQEVVLVYSLSAHHLILILIMNRIS